MEAGGEAQNICRVLQRERIPAAESHCLFPLPFNMLDIQTSAPP